MSGKARLLYDAVFLKTRSLAPQFNPETSVSNFEIGLHSYIKFVPTCKDVCSINAEVRIENGSSLGFHV